MSEGKFSVCSVAPYTRKPLTESDLSLGAVKALPHLFEARGENGLCGCDRAASAGITVRVNEAHGEGGVFKVLYESADIVERFGILRLHVSQHLPLCLSQSVPPMITPLTLRHQVVNVSGLDELCRVFGDGQSLEVSFAALDLGAFLVAQIVGEEAALGLDHEVEALRSILFD